MRRKGFTLVELLVVVAIIALLIGILLPAIGRARELANRTKCAANIRGIGQAMIAYASSFDGSFPKWQSDVSGTATGFNDTLNPATTGTDGTEPPSPPDSTTENNMTASLYIMVTEGDVQDQMFVCPSSPDSTEQGTDEVYDFEDASTMSYSFLNFFHQDLRVNWTDKRLSSAYAIGADDNDGDKGNIDDINAMTSEEKENWNSTNHQNDGQNVLFGDGHAAWNNDPLAGVNNDNVFAWGDTDDADLTDLDNALPDNDGDPNTNTGDPTEDSVLVPVEDLE